MVGRRGTMVGRRGTMVGRRGTMVGRRGTMVGRRGTMVGRRGTMVGRRGWYTWLRVLKLSHAHAIEYSINPCAFHSGDQGLVSGEFTALSSPLIKLHCYGIH